MAEYIARAAAIVDFERCKNENPVWTPQRVKTLLMRIPTADVEPVRHSEWVAQCLLPGDGWVFEDMPYNPHQHSNPICKRCRKGALLDGGEEYVTSPYCPNCGAKMVSGE